MIKHRRTAKLIASLAALSLSKRQVFHITQERMVFTGYPTGPQAFDECLPGALNFCRPFPFLFLAFDNIRRVSKKRLGLTTKI